MEAVRGVGAKGAVDIKGRGSHRDRATCCSSGPQTLFFGTVRRPDRVPEAPPRRLEWPRKDAEGCIRPSKALSIIGLVLYYILMNF